ncbi:Histone-lysine N-methyltransferase atxr6 [Orobanche hederae]
MASLRKRTRAPKSVPSKLGSRKRSRSKQEEEEDHIDVCCVKCGSGQHPTELLLCDKCDHGFHLFCLRPVLVAVPKGRWFCPSCSNDKNTTLPSCPNQDCRFFPNPKVLTIHRETQPRLQKKTKTNWYPGHLKEKSRKLLPFNPSEDPVRRLEQMASLASALTATGTEFSNELTYVSGMAPRSANLAALERDGMQVLSKDDMETLDFCKNMVVFDPREGFTVEADRHIRDLTIITEYVGDVDYLKNREDDDGDSMMTLLTADDPSRSLVICPDKRSDIARFINGINNHIPGGKKKQNLKCLRFNVNGECRVLLIASRDIRKGERLYYDYNGYENEYPTEHFI